MLTYEQRKREKKERNINPGWTRVTIIEVISNEAWIVSDHNNKVGEWHL